VRKVLRADGLVDLIGADNIHGSVDRAISAQLSSERAAAERFGHPAAS
jgi:hypothetical protein